MKILVTGGAGFIGSHVADAFLAEGHDVCIADDLSSGTRDNVPAGARFYEVDVRSPELEEVFRREQPEAVSHQAALANVRESFDDPLRYAEVNVLGSLRLLEYCRAYEVGKVIYACTGGASYGEPDSLPVTEEHPVNPLDPYGASKHHVEHYLFLYSRSFGVRYTSLRYPNVYGERQSPHGEAGVVAIFARKMLDGEAPLVNGNGQQERDFVHVSDVARANVLALRKGDDQILNIGTGVGTSVNDIVQELRHATGFSAAIHNGPSKQGEVYKISLDGTRAGEVLGWTPQVSLRDGIAATVEHLRDRQAA